MKGAIIGRYGGNEVVEIGEVSRPVPGEKEVLVRVQGASVNPVDWKIRSGKVRLLTGRRFPKVLGLECAGEIAEVGPGVQRFAVGEQVVAFSGVRRLGAFAEYLCVSESGVFHAPQNLTAAEAATLPIAAVTALQALRDLGRLAAGKKVLINGASGGVGTFAVQIARRMGAEVTAVCSAANAELVRSLGAGRVIDYTRQDYTRETERYDLIFDAVSKSSFARSKRALAPKGIYVATLPSPSAILNRYLTGFFTRRQARIVIVKPNAKDMAWLKDEIEAGRLRVVIDRSYPLEQIRDAFAYSETGKARGKVVLTVSEQRPFDMEMART
jgi:NADPH:quinone reductase-like Zn-dependent oxidoreductase